ncbi:MAG TPA: hypothetical protein VJP59_04035 [Gemmatimonadota bacterium]|nr:hypothetical protein [Gemmatimonadota bacterium]
MTRPEVLRDSGPEPVCRERIVRRILARAEPTLALYAGRPGPVATLAEWLRPALAAAAFVGLIAAAFLAAGRSPARAQPAVSEALGYPPSIVGWVEAGRRPSVEELLVAMEVRRP